MSLVFAVLLVLLIGCCTVHSKTVPPALQFEPTIKDYVQLPNGIMDNSTSRFSLCSWVKKRYRASHSVMFNYYPDSGDIILGDDGYFNNVVGSSLYLGNDFLVPDGDWFHLCWTWSTVDYTTRVYLNGVKVGSRETEHRELNTGGRACLGNNASDTKSTSNIFGGDLYKFNIYRRVLELGEIRVLAADMCSSAEDELASSMILTWEEVLQNERAGNVTEIYTTCDTQQKLRLIEEQLNSTRKDLNDTRKELKERLKEIRTNQKKNERLYLILTIVLGELSAALIILLTTLLILVVKRLPAQIRRLAPERETEDQAENQTEAEDQAEDQVEDQAEAEDQAEGLACYDDITYNNDEIIDYDDEALLIENGEVGS